MKTFAVLLVAAAILLGGFAASSPAGVIEGTQRVHFTYAGYVYWAFIYDYTYSTIESKTPGFIAYDIDLTYEIDFNDIHVAYNYNQFAGRYTQALAMRHAILSYTD